ncbi:MAG: hypothetical protein ACQEQV_08325, partial [Fibrobacterota bacterium]
STFGGNTDIVTGASAPLRSPQNVRKSDPTAESGFLPMDIRALTQGVPEKDPKRGCGKNAPICTVQIGAEV